MRSYLVATAGTHKPLIGHSAMPGLFSHITFTRSSIPNRWVLILRVASIKELTRDLFEMIERERESEKCIKLIDKKSIPLHSAIVRYYHAKIFCCRKHKAFVIILKHAKKQLPCNTTCNLDGSELNLHQANAKLLQFCCKGYLNKLNRISSIQQFSQSKFHVDTLLWEKSRQCRLLAC